MEKQIGYSKLFIDLTALDIEPDDTSIENPFIYLVNYLEEYDVTSSPIDFKKNLSYQKSLQIDTDFAYDCFLLEITHINDKKTEYLNEIINFLFKQYENSLNPGGVITNCIRQVFTQICLSHFNVYIDSNNRNRLSKWHTLKEPIKSFILKKVPEDKWFRNRIWYKMTNKFEYGFISSDTTFTSFKALFEGKYVENKINWIENKSSLIYFVTSLISSKVIESPRNKHWKIVSEFFLLEGEPIKKSDLLNQKATKDKFKRQSIDKLIRALVNHNS